MSANVIDLPVIVNKHDSKAELCFSNYQYHYSIYDIRPCVNTVVVTTSTSYPLTTWKSLSTTMSIPKMTTATPTMITAATTSPLTTNTTIPTLTAIPSTTRTSPKTTTTYPTISSTTLSTTTTTTTTTTTITTTTKPPRPLHLYNYK